MYSMLFTQSNLLNIKITLPRDYICPHFLDGKTKERLGEVHWGPQATNGGVS